ncbi:MAG: hypothetical protein H6672_13150 [Anaerolineaceae bacterium]|nr:hypothetical protein [Anaerolineaceae bacterium]
MPNLDSNSQQEIVTELNNLKRKAALMQDCHGRLSERFSSWESKSSIIITVFAAVAFIATTAETKTLFDFVSENDLKRVAALCSLIVFLSTLVKLETRWGMKASAHQATLNAFTRYLRHIDMILKSVDNKSYEELEAIALQLTTEYSNIGDFSPNIPSAQFLDLKQKHLQKVAISRALDANPFQSQRKLRHEIARTNQDTTE